MRWASAVSQVIDPGTGVFKGVESASDRCPRNVSNECPAIGRIAEVCASLAALRALRQAQAAAESADVSGRTPGTATCAVDVQAVPQLDGDQRPQLGCVIRGAAVVVAQHPPHDRGIEQATTANRLTGQKVVAKITRRRGPQPLRDRHGKALLAAVDDLVRKQVAGDLLEQVLALQAMDL